MNEEKVNLNVELELIESWKLGGERKMKTGWMKATKEELDTSSMFHRSVGWIYLHATLKKERKKEKLAVSTHGGRM